MRILGISNPDFLGVSVATKAVSTSWLPAPHMTLPYEWQHLSTTIFHANPDVLVVGGWSQGYTQLLTELKRSGNKNFPIINVNHSTPFHGSYFHEDWMSPEFEQAFKAGLIDIMGFVHPQTARYYQEVRNTFAVWLPHAFEPMKKVIAQPIYRIGVLGADNWYKNVQGSLVVARDFAAVNEDVEIVTQPGYSRPQEAFVAMVNSCSVLVHLSHLECYSNTLQEAWARGVPVLFSPANDGLVQYNPLLNSREKEALNMTRLTSSIEPVQLWKLLGQVRNGWESRSSEAHNIYHNLYYKTQAYLKGVFTRLVEDYPNRVHDVGFFEAPFHGGEDERWRKLTGHQ